MIWKVVFLTSADIFVGTIGAVRNLVAEVPLAEALAAAALDLSVGALGDLVVLQGPPGLGQGELCKGGNVAVRIEYLLINNVMHLLKNDDKLTCNF